MKARSQFWSSLGRASSGGSNVKIILTRRPRDEGERHFRHATKQPKAMGFVAQMKSRLFISAQPKQPKDDLGQCVFAPFLHTSSFKKGKWLRTL